jgi:hypothetical protein
MYVHILIAEWYQKYVKYGKHLYETPEFNKQ